MVLAVTDPVWILAVRSMVVALLRKNDFPEAELKKMETFDETKVEEGRMIVEANIMGGMILKGPKEFKAQAVDMLRDFMGMSNPALRTLVLSATLALVEAKKVRKDLIQKFEVPYTPLPLFFSLPYPSRVRAAVANRTAASTAVFCRCVLMCSPNCRLTTLDRSSPSSPSP